MEVEDICFDPMGAAMLDDVIYPGNTVLTVFALPKSQKIGSVLTD